MKIRTLLAYAHNSQLKFFLEIHKLFSCIRQRTLINLQCSKKSQNEIHFVSKQTMNMISKYYIAFNVKRAMLITWNTSIWSIFSTKNVRTQFQHLNHSILLLIIEFSSFFWFHSKSKQKICQRTIIIVLSIHIVLFQISTIFRKIVDSNTWKYFYFLFVRSYIKQKISKLIS